MKNKKRENRSDADTSKGATPNDQESVIVIRDAIGLLVSGIFAGLFFETGHKVAGIWFSYIGLLAAFHIPFHHCYVRKKPAWGLYFLLIIAIAVWFLIWSHEILSSVATDTIALARTESVSTLTKEPSQIEDEINRAAPMQQDAIRESFIGAKVKWLLNLESISGGTAIFNDRKGLGNGAVFIDLSNEQKNQLRLADQGASFYVSGTISIMYPDETIQLSNSKLEPYSNDTHMK